MNPYIIIFGLALIVTLPIAFLLGGKAYLNLLAIITVVILFVFGMLFAYWYIFKKVEFK